ncbi:MAG: OmpW family protein [Rhodospirillales bacterium]|nr:OmpW family protein [Rhodospirillales bacterium]
MKKLFKTLSIALAVGMAMTVSGIAQAKDAGDLLVRLRAIGIIPQEDGTTDLIGGDVTLDETIVPELDFTYFFTENIAAELILATARFKPIVNGSTLGRVPLGEVWVIPPVLTAQYHLFPKSDISPYLGAGVAYHIFYGQNEDGAPAIIHNVDYDDGFGWALQAGVDVAIGERWSLNLDVKKVFFNTDVTVSSAAGTIRANDVDIDHWIVGVGVGVRF